MTGAITMPTDTALPVHRALVLQLDPEQWQQLASAAEVEALVLEAWVERTLSRRAKRTLRRRDQEGAAR